MGKVPKRRRQSSRPHRGELASQPPDSGSPPSGPVGTSSSRELALASPHDELFKATFQSIDNATSLIRSALPEDVSRRFDWSTLQLEPTEHIDSHLTKRYGDLHFRAHLTGGDRDAYIEVALEHQSTPDRIMALRVLGIIVRRTEDLLRQRREQRKREGIDAAPEADRLPIVLPVVVFQGEAGKKTPWRYPVRYSELLDADAETLTALRNHVPDFEFVLDDLPSQSDAELAARGLNDATLVTAWLLTNVGIDDANLLERLRKSNGISATFQQLAANPLFSHWLAAIYRYLYRTVDLPYKAIHAFAHEQGKIAEEAEMTAAERLIEQGLEQGLEQGRAEGAAATLERLIARKFQVAIDEAIRARLASASAQELALWTDRILSAQSLDELLAE